MPVSPTLATDVRLGRALALIGSDRGKYPYGNSLLVEGTEERVLIDPSLSIAERGGAPAPVDRMLISHAHEDHMAGMSTFPDASVHAHHDDLLALHSLDGFLTVYGMPPEIEQVFAPTLTSDFHYAPRVDATGFADGTAFDHTRGHCGFLVEPDGVFFVADIDLTSFGPYYGDHWSDLEDFERAIERARTIDARWYVTFHHKGIVEGASEFRTQLDAFASVIADRERRMLAYLEEPRSIGEMVAHRFVYRPGVQVTFADHVERLTAERHLTRLVRNGEVVELPAEGPHPLRYRKAA
jgi:glyoxylase-like metal-dependent hydrolase (beta-lactamase superfamily II)